jgi:hypothetical protein
MLVTDVLLESAFLRVGQDIRWLHHGLLKMTHRMPARESNISMTGLQIAL